MRIVHLADPCSPGGGACALAELAGVIRHWKGASHAVVLIGHKSHEQLARRCGLSVRLRVALSSQLPWMAHKALCDRAESLMRPCDAVIAWTASSTSLASLAWPATPVIARLSVGQVGWSAMQKFMLRPPLRRVWALTSNKALACACDDEGFDAQRIAFASPGVDLLTPGMTARADVRRAWMAQFNMPEKAFVIGLMGEPVRWPDARMAVEVVARLALAGRNVRILIHPSSARRIEALTLLRRLGMVELVMESDDLAEPWRVISGLDAALALGVDFRAVGNAIRSAARPTLNSLNHSPSVNRAVMAAPKRRPAPSIAPIAWCFAAGVPVVAHDLPSTRELIQHDVTGLLVTEHDMNPASDGLARLYDDWPLRQRLSTAAGEVAKQRLSMPLLVDRLEQTVDDALHGRPTAHVVAT